MCIVHPKIGKEKNPTNLDHSLLWRVILAGRGMKSHVCIHLVLTWILLEAKNDCIKLIPRTL